MKFGVREVANIVFRAKSVQKLGDYTFEKGEPVIYFDSAKTSTVESASTTVYAQGGRGNPRIMAWEGDKTATFTFEEALLSSLGFSILSGANLIESVRIPFHHAVQVEAETQNVALDGDTGSGAAVPVLDLSDRIPAGAQVLGRADENLSVNGNYQYPMGQIYVMELEEGEIVKRIKVNQDGALTEDPATAGTQSLVLNSVADVVSPSLFATDEFKVVSAFLAGDEDTAVTTVNSATSQLKVGSSYLVDFYALQNGSEMTVTADKFAGYYYIEADTLFRRASDGKDVPAQFVIPKGKVQSNFNFTMAGTGDPSTFTFTVDAFPDYTIFDSKCKVLFALQIAEEAVENGDC